MLVEFTVNGELRTVSVDPDEKLLDTLRDRLQITSVKRGCENGDCGACTVLLNGEPITSCIFLTAKAHGQSILTIEAFSGPGKQHPIQEEFKKAGAFQCGFCAPGVTLSAIALLNRNPTPNDQEIRDAIYGNLCRCSGYVQIIQAIKNYVERMHEANGK